MDEYLKHRDSLAIRTDFSDEAVWKSVCAALVAPYGIEQFRANVRFVDDRRFDGFSVDELLADMPDDPDIYLIHTFIFMVDHRTISDPEHPTLVVDLYHEPGRTFRVIPSEMWSVENNLSIANMDFEEFADNVDEAGVFRGFD